MNPEGMIAAFGTVAQYVRGCKSYLQLPSVTTSFMTLNDSGSENPLAKLHSFRHLGETYVKAREACRRYRIYGEISELDQGLGNILRSKAVFPNRK